MILYSLDRFEVVGDLTTPVNNVMTPNAVQLAVNLITIIAILFTKDIYASKDTDPSNSNCNENRHTI